MCQALLDIEEVSLLNEHLKDNRATYSSLERAFLVASVAAGNV